MQKVSLKPKVGRKMTSGARKATIDIPDNEIKKMADSQPDTGMRVRWLSNKYDDEQKKMPRLTKT